jgi:hypothetical protein
MSLYKWMVFLLISIGSILILKCENDETGEVEFILDPRLELDSNGYYHLELNLNTIQTTHRFSGHIYEDGQPLDVVKFNWESSHYWILGDTLGYIYQEGYTNDFIYTTYDTSYIIGFEGFEVPTINCCSYSNSDGEVNTIFGPTRKMRGDTVRVSVDCILSEELSQTFKIILD